MDDGQYDWILHKQAILDKRNADEEAERRAKATQALLMANSRAGKKNQAKLQLMEEEERKRKEEEERKAPVIEKKILYTFKKDSLPLLYKLVNVGVTDPCA